MGIPCDLAALTSPLVPAQRGEGEWKGNHKGCPYVDSGFRRNDVRDSSLRFGMTWRRHGMTWARSDVDGARM